MSTTPTSTLTPVPSSTAIPTESPTPTFTPTPTEQLSPQEQRELDFGQFVPIHEDCVLNEGVPFRDFQPDALYAQFRFHYTGAFDDTTIPVVVDGVEEPRTVKLIQVVCRDASKNIGEPIWIVLGGYDFGKHRGGENVYWTNGGSRLSITDVSDMFSKLKPGEEIWAVLPVKTGSSTLRNDFWDHNGGDELADQSIREFPKVQDQVNLLLNRNSVTQKDLVLIPTMLKFGPFPKIIP